MTLTTIPCPDVHPTRGLACEETTGHYDPWHRWVDDSSPQVGAVLWKDDGTERLVGSMAPKPISRAEANKRMLRVARAMRAAHTVTPAPSLSLQGWATRLSLDIGWIVDWDSQYTRLEPDEDGGLERFLEFHSNNPDVLAEIVELAREDTAAGFTRMGLDIYIGLIRYKRRAVIVDADDEEYVLNNNYRMYYTRVILQKYPEFRGTEKKLDFFEVRDHATRKLARERALTEAD